MEKYILQNLEKKPSLVCRDYTLSRERFELHQHRELDMLVTCPQPKVAELSQYYESDDYISHTDSRKSLFEKVYQLVKGFMIDRKLHWIENETPGKGHILDIGAGTGDFLARAKKDGWKISGTEPNQRARSLTSEKGIHLEEETSGYGSGSFDVITMWHVLEHISDLDSQIKELGRLLKDDGVLVIAVPNFKSYDANFHREYWAAYDVPRHLWHFSGSAISKLFAAHGFKVTRKKPLLFDAFYVSLLSEKYKTGKISFVRGLYHGLLSNLKARHTKEYSSVVYFLKRTPDESK